MDELVVFLTNYGWQLALIALAGIIILGVLKYCNVFSKFDEKIRHVFYLLISVGISVIGAIIYLACMKSLTVEYAFAVATAILALNQTFYAIYDCTDLKSLFVNILKWVVDRFDKGDDKDDFTTEDTEGTQLDDSQNTTK